MCHHLERASYRIPSLDGAVYFLLHSSLNFEVHTAQNNVISGAQRHHPIERNRVLAERHFTNSHHVACHLDPEFL